MSTDPDSIVCSVCGAATPVAMTAECNWCDQRYHLNQRNDVEGKDCGTVWIDEQYMALQFACNTCLAGPAQAAGARRPASAVTTPPRRITPKAAPADAANEPRRRRYRRRA